MIETKEIAKAENNDDVVSKKGVYESARVHCNENPLYVFLF
jgi:hypothetical protein